MFVFPDSLNIHNVKEVQEQLLEFLQQGEPGKTKEEVVMDAGNINDIDAAGLQLLLSTCKTIRREGRKYRLVNQGQLLNHLLELSGAGDILEKEDRLPHE